MKKHLGEKVNLCEHTEPIGWSQDLGVMGVHMKELGEGQIFASKQTVA